MTFNSRSARELFSIDEIFDSGGRQAKLRVVDLTEDGIRIQSVRSQSSKFFLYSYIQIVIDGFEKIIPTSVHESIQPVLIAAGETNNYWTENYAYGIARAFLERSTSAIFLSDGEILLPPSPESEPASYREGRRLAILVERIERDPRARMACIDHFGPVCQACCFDFEATYGEIGKGFIHVHHQRKLAETDGQHLVDPLVDLIPLCPNCHAMAHARQIPLSVTELRGVMKAMAARG
jgi:5-methylcytosine-specific restriction protein A